jgi:CRISP-associated protein Cas1
MKMNPVKVKINSTGEMKNFLIMLKRSIYFSKPARLSLKDQQLVYKPAEGDIKTLPIEDLGFVVLEDQQISVSLPLLECIK